MFTAAAASGRKTRKGRSGKSDPVTKLLISSVPVISPNPSQAQLLAGRFGLTGSVASAVAAIVWGGSRDDS